MAAARGFVSPVQSRPSALRVRLSGESRQVGGNHPGANVTGRQSRPRVESPRGQVYFPDPVLAGFRDEQVPLVAGQRDAVWEAQPADHDSDPGRRGLVHQHSARAGVLEDVENGGVERPQLLR
jgi:hypothetical protein